MPSCPDERPALTPAAVRSRLLTALVALACALVGVGLAGLFGLRPRAWGSRLDLLATPWLAIGLALALEPAAGAARWRTAATVAGAALLAAAAGLWLGDPVESNVVWRGGDPDTLGRLALLSAWFGNPVRATLVCALATLPGPALLLAVRRVGRQLEWQAAAAALGTLVVGVAWGGAAVLGWELPSLLVSGLPLAFGAYLVDRRVLGDDLPAFGAGTPARARVLGGVALGGLAAACLVAWAGPRALTGGLEPGCLQLEEVLEDLRAMQARHTARTGASARELAALEGVAPDVAGGYAHGHVLRYARLDGRRWVITADPIPARKGWPSLRLVGPDGELERGTRPFRLEAP